MPDATRQLPVNAKVAQTSLFAKSQLDEEPIVAGAARLSS